MGKRANLGRELRSRGAAAKEGNATAGRASASQDSENVLPFYSDRAGHRFREFSNFFRLARPYEFHLPEFAWSDGFPKSLWCGFSEKAIMATKAAMMCDLASFQAIDAADDPKSCKSLGRGVRNFDEDLWQRHLEDVAFEVVRQKFASDGTLRELLLSTGHKILAEAAPNDCVWGVGLGLSDGRVADPSQWRGRNVLGYALMRARDHFQGGAVAAPAASDSGGAARGTDVSMAPDAAAASADTLAAKSRRWATSRASRSSHPADAQGADASSQADNSLSSRTADGGIAAEVRPIAAASEQMGVANSDGQTFTCFAVLDFEATCDDKRRVEPQEVIEFPLVLIDVGSLEKIAEFRTYVRPIHHPRLTPFCTELTGIRQHDIDDAPAWSEALASAQAFLDEAERCCLFVTCGDWDLGDMLGRQCAASGQHVPRRFGQWLNIKNLFGKVTGRPGKSMKQMLAELGLGLEGRHHSGLDDSRNIARILVELLRTGGKVEADMLSHARPRTSKGKAIGNGKF